MTSQGVENTCVDCKESFSYIKLIETPLGGIWATSYALLLFLLHVSLTVLEYLSTLPCMALLCLRSFQC